MSVTPINYHEQEAAMRVEAAQNKKNAIYDRLRLSIADLRDIGRISKVESRALMELTYELNEQYKKKVPSDTKELKHQNECMTIMIMDVTKALGLKVDPGLPVSGQDLLEAIGNMKNWKDASCVGSILAAVGEALLGDVGGWMTKARLLEAIGSMKKTISHDREMIDSQAADIARIMNENRTLGESIGALNDSLGVIDIVCIKPLVDGLKGDLAGKNIEIDRLRQEVTDRVSERDHLAENVLKLEGEIDTLTEQHQHVRGMKVSAFDSNHVDVCMGDHSSGIPCLLTRYEKVRDRLYHILLPVPATGQTMGHVQNGGFVDNPGSWGKWNLADACTRLRVLVGTGHQVTLLEAQP